MADIEGDRRMVCVLNGDTINKEIRLWRRGSAKFKNPVFESLQPDEGKPISILIAGTSSPDRLNELLAWKKDKPHHQEVDYYLACQYLMRKDYDLFRKHANQYLFRGSGYSAIMTRYYLSQVHLHILKDSQGAIEHLMHCLAEKPLMAELWCTLGDCYYRSGVPHKAIEFFEIAVSMGKERSPDDPYPIELSKYAEYPLKMIELCKEIKKAQSSH
jgi:tetratricopeptide (TPR) repeat protein